MTLEEVIALAKEKASGFDSSKYEGFLAIQVTLKDIDRVFYVEIKDGKLSIEPYEYHDRQVNLIISSKKFVKLIEGDLNPVMAFTTGQLKVEGDVEKALEFSKLF